MDVGENDFSNYEMLANSIMGDKGFDCSMDSLFDEVIKDTDTYACTHAHTCTLHVADNAHAHTCMHVHTKIVPLHSEEKIITEDTCESKDKDVNGRRPVGNREAVRKYKERKKARVSLLEEEVVRLRAMNQQLVKRLQGKAGLETELSRLKCLLVDIRGKIGAEIGCFPYQKSVDGNVRGGFVMNHCSMPCNDQFYCPCDGGVMGNGLGGQYLTGCEFGNPHCLLVPTIQPLPCHIGSGNGVMNDKAFRSTNEMALAELQMQHKLEF